jgi:hypothetical protein
MEALFETLCRRRRPEDVAELVRHTLKGKLDPREAAILDRAARGSLARRPVGYTSMLQDFARPRGLVPTLARAATLFADTSPLDEAAASDAASVEGYARALGGTIEKVFGESNFLHDRLNGEARGLRGLDVSRRKYNRKFRLLRRMERKIGKLTRETMKLEFTQIGKSGLATRLPRAGFFASESSACFIAYLVARCNLRSELTIDGQQKAMDEIAAMLLARCRRDEGASWLSIAHVYPQEEVLSRLSDGEKLELLSTWLEMLHSIAGLLGETWDKSRFDLRTMIVRRGNDSTTWNNTASAWNKARDHFIALVYALGMDDLLDGMCLGKVMRLMAADVASWHRRTGGGLDPGTLVWAELPRPWEVLSGRARCSRAEVELVCQKHGVDPVASGWIAPRPPATVAKFRRTPELVHGVTVNHPYLATVLRKAGWYSGEPRAANLDVMEEDTMSNDCG